MKYLKTIGQEAEAVYQKKKMKLHEILKNNLSVDWGSLPKKLVISYYNTY